jgi:hypothetical protein
MPNLNTSIVPNCKSIYNQHITENITKDSVKIIDNIPAGFLQFRKKKRGMERHRKTKGCRN